MGDALGNIEGIKKGLSDWGRVLDLGEDTYRRWAIYADLAEQWGRRMDLTAPGGVREQHELLFLDAAVLIDQSMISTCARVVDVGAGVGAPTLPLAIAWPELRAVLVEPRRKRVAFLRYAVGVLGLQDRVTVLECRVSTDEPFVEGQPFDVALSRATFAPERWLGVGSSLASEILVMLGRAAPPTHTTLSLKKQCDYSVPSSGSPRSLLLYS